MSSQVTIVTKKRSRAMWAAFGFLMIVALLVIAWILAPGLITLLKGSFRGFRTSVGTMEPLHLQIAFTLIIFVILALISAIVVTIASPRRPLQFKDKELVKERKDALDYQRAARKRQRKLNREMRQFVEKNQKQ
jgi:hypothetical protein